MLSFWLVYFIGFGLFAFLAGKALEKENASSVWLEYATIFIALLWPASVIGIIIVAIVSLFQHNED